jgi:hypothetical protein
MQGDAALRRSSVVIPGRPKAEPGIQDVDTAALDSGFAQERAPE